MKTLHTYNNETELPCHAELVSASPSQWLYASLDKEEILNQVQDDKLVVQDDKLVVQDDKLVVQDNQVDIAGAKQNVIPTQVGIHSKTAHKHLDSRPRLRGETPNRGNDEPHLILFCASYSSGQPIGLR